MTLTLTAHEAGFLRQLLEVAHRERLHELHHTATASFRARLRGEVEVLESLIERIETPITVAPR